MLKQRIITAAILIPITLVVLYYLPPPAFLILTALIALGGVWEWTNLMEIHELSKRFFYLLMVTFVFGWALFIPVTVILVIALIWWLIAFALIVFYPRLQWMTKNWFVSGVMGVLVLLPCWVAINYIRNEKDGLYALLFLFILIWGADSVAYFTGKKWGKTKLAPLISPGKTVQGLGGAIIFSILYVLLVLLILRIPMAIWPWAMVLSLVTVIFSVVGDLFESMMKRLVGLKDSGKILPGHGGLLDRIDSLTAAAPIFVVGGLLLGMYLS